MEQRWSSLAPTGSRTPAVLEEVTVTTYAGCVAGFRDAALVPGVRELRRRMALDVASAGPVSERYLLWTDGQEHAALRRTVAPWFTPARVASMQLQIAAVTDDLLDGLTPDAPADFMDEVAKRVPGPVFCQIAGAPITWSDELFDLSEQILKVSTGNSEFTTSIAAAAARLAELVAELLAAKQRVPGDDITSALLAQVDGEHLTTGDVAGLVFEMLAASTDNTAHSIGSAVHLLATNPDQYQRLRSEPGLAGPAFDEAARLEPRVRTNPRHAVAAATIEGRSINPGALVFLSISTANRDPHLYGEPDRFDIARQPAQPHLGFGVGRHRCLGEKLARMEAICVLSSLLQRWSAIDLAGDADITRTNNTTVGRLPILVR